MLLNISAYLFHCSLDHQMWKEAQGNGCCCLFTEIQMYDFPRQLLSKGVFYGKKALRRMRRIGLSPTSLRASPRGDLFLLTSDAHELCFLLAGLDTSPLWPPFPCLCPFSGPCVSWGPPCGHISPILLVELTLCLTLMFPLAGH